MKNIIDSIKSRVGLYSLTPVNAKASAEGLVLKKTLWLSILTAGFIALGSCLATTSARADYTATVDANTKYQTIEGWGTSLCWFAHVIGGYPDSYRNDYVNKIFDPVSGLGLNAVRYNIGGGENPSKSYLQFRAKVPGFEPSQGTWNWSADANQRWFLQQAIAKGANQLEAFSNSPPYWMTVSGSVTGEATGKNNLDPAYYNAFADYLTEVVRHYRDTWGITFATLDPLNEPRSNWWKLGGGQEGCHFDEVSQANLVKLVGASLVSKGLTGTKVSAPDENNINQTLLSITRYDAAAVAYLGGINTHSYNGTQRAELFAAAKANGKRLWMSEYGDGDATGLNMSRTILSDMRDMKPVVWVYWQAVDNASGWGFLKNALDGSSNYSYTINQKYYVMGNYSKFMRPGYQVVDINDANSLAAYNAATQTLVIVTTGTSAAQTVTYNLSNFGGSWTATPYRTGNGLNLAPLAGFNVAGTSFSSAIPANSVTTFVLTKNTSSISNGIYKIISRKSGLALDVAAGSTANGANVDQATYTGGTNQQWTVTSLGSGQYSIIGVGSGKSLDVTARSTADGANIEIYTYGGGNHQRWTFTPTTNGYYTITSVNSGKVVDVVSGSTASGANVDQWTSNGGTNQQWQLAAP
jgi:O-glycosyl hydrolase